MAAGLVGDIGGTHARFALAREGAGYPVLDQVLTLPGRDYASLEQAARAYLARVGNPVLHAAALACAGPVIEGGVSFTNLAWSTTEAALAAATGIARVHLLNDLAAVAWAAPVLQAGGLRRIAHSGAVITPAPPLGGRATRAILNAGTGCNASAFVHNESGQAVVVGEYGHASFAPVDDLEVAIWQRLHAMFGRVSIERVLCGPGLLNLYRALADIEDTQPICQSPAEISEAAAAGQGLAHRAVAQFCALMGSVAGDVALCFGARGGVFLAGGVAALLLSEAFDTSFRTRLEDKGRFATYLADIPTQLITDPNVALIGAARAMAGLGIRP